MTAKKKRINEALDRLGLFFYQQDKNYSADGIKTLESLLDWQKQEINEAVKKLRFAALTEHEIKRAIEAVEGLP